MDLAAIQKSYARWAPVYDGTFGPLTNPGRKRAVAYLNARGGTVLEVGVGTGLALPLYGLQMRVTGVDYSTDMLDKARAKVADQGLSQVVALHRMDARALEFPDDSFDSVAAMHVLSVVPEPERVLTEMTRVCKPGGKIVITNHFAQDKGLWGVITRAFAPLANLLGWHSDFKRDRVLGTPGLRLCESAVLPPLGMMTFLVLEKTA